MSEWQYPLRRGNSPDPKSGACLLDAVSWIEYGALGDHPDCVCAALAGYGRALNDWLPYAERQNLRPFIPLLAGSNAGDDVARARARLIATEAMTIAKRAGYRSAHSLAPNPVFVFEAVRARGVYTGLQRTLYEPAIALLGTAIAFGQRAAPPLEPERVIDGNRRFLLARAA